MLQEGPNPSLMDLSVSAPLEEPSKKSPGPSSSPDIVKSDKKDVSATDFSILDAVSIDGREAIVIMDLRPEHQFIKVRWLDDCSESPVIAIGSVEVIKLEAGKGDVVSVNGKEGTIIMDMRPDHNFVKVKWSNTSSDGELVVATAVKLVRRKGCSEDFGKGDKVMVSGRAGTVTMDLRPDQEFVKVRWLDDGSDSEVLAVYTVALHVVSKGSSGQGTPAAAAEVSDKPFPSAEATSSSQDVSSGAPEATPELSSTPVWLDPQEEMQEPSGGAYDGIVIIYEREKGHGFISSARVEGDVFFYVADCIAAETVECDKVSFDIEENEIGMKIAKRIVGGSIPFPEEYGWEGEDMMFDEGNAPVPTGTCEGVVRTPLLGDGDYGFISYQESDQVRDVFFHIGDCIDGIPAQGDRVRFKFGGWLKDGSPNRKALQITGCSMPKKGTGKDSGTAMGNKGKDKGHVQQVWTTGSKWKDTTKGKGWKGGKAEFNPGTNFSQRFDQGKRGKGKVISPPSRMFPAGGRHGAGMAGPAHDFWGPAGRNGYVSRTIHRNLHPFVESMHDQELFELGKLSLSDQFIVLGHTGCGKGARRGKKGAPY